MAVYETNHQSGRASGGERSADGGASDEVGDAIRQVWSVALASALVACASSNQLVTGTPRSAIPAAEVRVYTQTPQHFEEIAVFEASRKSVSTASGERAIARMIDSMRSRAARLGANGLLLENFSDSNALALGTGVGSQTYTHNGSISIGVGGSLGVVNKLARARAIFVAPLAKASELESD